MINTKWPLVLSVALAAVCLLKGNEALSVLTEKAKAQAVVTDSVERWKQQYLALGDTAKQWDEAFKPESSVQDMLTLLSLVRLNEYGLMTDIDKTALAKYEPVAHNGSPVGLMRICLMTFGTNGGLEVSSGSYQRLFDGIDQLAKRRDIDIGNINVVGNKERPVAVLGDFCVILRGA